uniref:Uncharacterized protein n=1 Tax=Anguilla anguilla TaxID=7936 RepID=A0A0E9WQG4_ANGAN
MNKQLSDLHFEQQEKQRFKRSINVLRHNANTQNIQKRKMKCGLSQENKNKTLHSFKHAE